MLNGLYGHVVRRETRRRGPHTKALRFDYQVDVGDGEPLRWFSDAEVVEADTWCEACDLDHPDGRGPCESLDG
jgi:hypothetical protein